MSLHENGKYSFYFNPMKFIFISITMIILHLIKLLVFIIGFGIMNEEKKIGRSFFREKKNKLFIITHQVCQPFAQNILQRLTKATDSCDLTIESTTLHRALRMVSD